jgi:hypothetical protein
MLSSGMRLEAWNSLHWNYIKPIEQGGKVLALKQLRIYGQAEPA